MKTKKHNKILINIGLFVVSMGILGLSLVFILIGSIRIPDFKSFENRKITSSTKIFDKTGEVLLYDLNQETKKTIIPFSEMGISIKNATVAIEDAEFYQHKGVRITSIIRAFIANILSGHLSQGGSTITQQVVKNSLLTQEKTISRKIKEWILAMKIERVVNKEDILALYLNETPYGGAVYGIKEASRVFFNKEPLDLTLAESAYLAAIPKAPTFYSPYRKNKDKLDERKNLVLQRMKDLSFITDDEYQKAKTEVVLFKPEEKSGIKAPHFIFYIKEYLEEKYGPEMVETGGLKVTSTLDYELQKKAEDIVLKQAKINEEKFKGSNAALVSIDPKTGQILAMVGSRDYFDKTIDGNFNVATASRQPGSAFKPFAYVTAFNMGYTEDTAIFDLPTEFSTGCSAYGKPLSGHSKSDCYMPDDFDNKYRGPMTFRSALAESINIPAVKVLYLTGIDNSIKTAREMGIKTLGEGKQYGLTLVIGGGEVTLLDMTSAYSVFANEGVKNSTQSILKIEDASGNVLEEYQPNPQEVLPRNSALMITDILSDNNARIPTFGANSSLYIAGKDVAAKTGTTNNNKDAWIMGYSPNLVTGVWVGNNDNTPMLKGGAALAGPIWKDFMVSTLATLPDEKFEKPTQPDNYNLLKPALQGMWQGGEGYLIDKISGKLATEFTPNETLEQKVYTDVHSILYWLNKDNPLDVGSSNSRSDSQFSHWEIPVRDWWARNKNNYPIVTEANKPTQYDDVHKEEFKPIISITSPTGSNPYDKNASMIITVDQTGSHFPLKKVDMFINDSFIGSIKNTPFTFPLDLSDVDNLKTENILKIIAYDSVFNSNEATTTFIVNE
ncbi:MAG: PBP1A family penicillin-binding protein [Candidatus Paceibacterota bacterium]|jgi:1A family penicillin-binding protein